MPQLLASVLVFTHVPLQLVVPLGHVHTPALHVVPPLHALAHVPQLLLSVEVFTQLEPHNVDPLGHVHTPLEHDEPDGHT